MKTTLVLLLPVAFAACAGDSPRPVASPSTAASVNVPAAPAGGTTVPASGPATYEVRGVVKAVDHGRMTVKLDHEEIPGFMAAMEMEYKVRPHTLLDGITVGAAVEGRLEASGTDYTIVSLRKR